MARDGDGLSYKGELKDRDSEPGHEAHGQEQLPAWFTPQRLLFILSLINFLNYLDRGALASIAINGLPADSSCVDGHGDGDSEPCFEGTGIMGELSLSYFQDGILASAFMVGLLVASPLFAEFSKTVSSLRLIGIGLAIWTIAAVGCGFSVDFWTITICRMFVGVAEASFTNLASPFIDDYAPQGKRTAWLSIFFTCVPVGLAAGVIYGGVVGELLGWRAAFWIEALVMLPLALFGLLSSPLHLRGTSPMSNLSKPLLSDTRVGRASVDGHEGGNPENEGAGRSEHAQYLTGVARQVPGLWKDVKTVLTYKPYIIGVLGFSAWNFSLGAYAYWGPRLMEYLFTVDNVDLIYGICTLTTGIVGTLAGGLILDRFGSSVPTAFKFLGLVTGIGAVVGVIAYSLKSLSVFLILFIVGQLCTFSTQGPAILVTLHTVPSHLRPMAIAIATVSIHVLGDVPSPPLVGVFNDFVHNWRLTAQLLSVILFLASGLWASGALVRPLANDEVLARNDEEASAISAIAGP